LAVLLFLLSLLLALLPLFPQAPSDPVATSRWLAEVQARFGSATDFLSVVGLFSLGRSPFFRLTLVVLAFLLLVRAGAWAERLWRGRRAVRGEGVWRPLADLALKDVARALRRRGYRVQTTVRGQALQADRWPWAELLALLAHVGPLLFLLGLLVGGRWGWRVEHLRGRPGETLSVPTDGEIAVVNPPAGRWVDPSGVRVYVEGTGPDLTAVVTGADGEPLGLQRAPGAAPSSSLCLRLTETETDAYFAVPEAGLVVRVALDAGAALRAEAPLWVQVFRSPSGELTQEVLVEGDADLVEGPLHIRLARSPYLIVTAVRDPGYWLKMVGLAIAGPALLGLVLWPARRLWVRQDGPHLVVAGRFPAEGRRLRFGAGMCFLRGLLALVVSGMAIHSLVRGGAVWDGSAVQAEATALWLAWMAVCLIWGDEKGGVE